MKKIILVTMQDNCNIGNRLQNYALQRILEQLGGKIINLDNGYTPKLSLKEHIKMEIKRFLVFFGNEKHKASVNKQFRRKAIEKFTDMNISNIMHVTYENVFKKKWDAYDIAIVGSDQVWHRWREDPKELPYYYLEFMPKEKRFSYAASFGFENFPMVDREKHIEGLRAMRAISCRERSGCVLVETEIGRSALQVLDPTLLLTAADWKSVEGDISRSVKTGEKFAFIYFLGEITEEYQIAIDCIVKERSLRIINFMDMQDDTIAHCGVGEFIKFIDCADYILTDSFHCTVFSVLFKKEFTVFRRNQVGFEKMFGRIEDLLSSMGKLNCIYGGTKRQPSNNFDKIYADSMKYINEILEMN